MKLLNLGLATPASQLDHREIKGALESGYVDDPLEIFPQLASTDLRDLGYSLLKLVIASFSPGGVMPAAFGCDGASDADCAYRLQRTVEGDHMGDLVGRFRQQLIGLIASGEVPELAYSLELLDLHDRSGWWLLHDLIKAPLLNGLHFGETEALLRKDWFKGVSPEESVCTPPQCATPPARAAVVSSGKLVGETEALLSNKCFKGVSPKESV